MMRENGGEHAGGGEMHFKREGEQAVRAVAPLEAITDIDTEKLLREDRKALAFAGDTQARVAYLKDKWRRLAKLHHPDWREVRADFERWANGGDGHEKFETYKDLTQEDFADILHEANDGESEMPRPDEAAIHEALSHLWRTSWRNFGKRLAGASPDNARNTLEIVAEKASTELAKFVRASNPAFTLRVDMHDGAFVGWKREDFLQVQERFNSEFAKTARELGFVVEPDMVVDLKWEDVSPAESAVIAPIAEERIIERAREHISANPTDLHPDPDWSGTDFGDAPSRFHHECTAKEYVNWQEVDFERLSTTIQKLRAAEREAAHYEEEDTSS